DRVLSRIGASTDDEEDYAVARFLDSKAQGQFDTAVAAVSKELTRYTQGAGLLLKSARGDQKAIQSADEHERALDTLNREIRNYTEELIKSELTPSQTSLLASLLEDQNFRAILSLTLSQITRRSER